MDPVADTLREEKKNLRRVMTARRDALPPGERSRRSAELSARLGTLPGFTAATMVSGFLPIRSEVDPGAALAAARARGATVVLPRISDGRPRLRFHQAGPDQLRPGPFGLLEPDTGCPEVPVEALDCILLPGLAFDASARRLGYGGGYYDEVAGRVRAAGHGILVGLGFEEQIVERVPHGPGDVVLDVVVTDARVVRRP